MSEDDKPTSRLPEPPCPEALAVVHLYRACCYIVDALMEDGMEDCREYDELRGTLFAVRMIATSIESSIRIHPAVQRAEQRFLHAWIRLDRDTIDVGFVPYDKIETITNPSVN